jgi:hypothetical protein
MTMMMMIILKFSSINAEVIVGVDLDPFCSAGTCTLYFIVLMC